MDQRIKHEKMTRQEKHPSLRQVVPVQPWDSVESDTESLAQERAYQQQLHMHINQNKYILPQEGNADKLQPRSAEDEDLNDDETEDLQVYDSLDIVAHPHGKRNPVLLQAEYVDTQTDEREGTSGLLSDDTYADLRYDPNWRTNLSGAGRFNDSPHVSIEEYYPVPEVKSGQASGDRQGLVVKGGYRYIADTSPAVVVTPHMAGSQFKQPYRLHPQDGQDNSVTSPHCHYHASQLRSPEADVSRPPSIFTENESDNTSQRRVRKQSENSCDSAAENISRSPELTKDVHAMYIQESNNYCQQEVRHKQGGATQTQRMSTSASPSLEVLSNKSLERLTEDIVKRNKITLGRNASKRGSYVTAHTLKQGVPQNVNKVHEPLQETDSTESQEDCSDPKLRWLQRAQQLRVTQISKGKKAQRKEYPNPPQQQQQPPAPGVRAERGDCLSSPLARRAAATQPKPLKTTSSQPLPPTVHLNINLNTSSHVLPILQQKGRDAVINVASLHGYPYWSPASDVELAFPPGNQQTNQGKSSHVSQKWINTQLHHRNLESGPKQWQRTTALKWPLSCEGEDQEWSPNEFHSEQFPQNLPGTPTTTSTLGSFTVLPPIGQPMTGEEPELSPMHRSSSDGYLVQMEKQKQLRTRITYKAYSFKDYKQLKSDINLRGLGPDYKAIEKTKMKRQRLYSNVIREQNKKISRIPFLPAKDLEGTDKKVPRMKALEYAKTIAKPPVPSQPKQRQKQRSEGSTEHAPHLEGLDMSQAAALEVLRKRHEEEKKAVALSFRKVHAV